MAIEVGTEAPDFTLDTQDKAKWTLSEQRGKNVVLLWYPLDWSPTCTTENCSLSGDFEEIEANNAVIVGISRDSVWSHKAWKDANNIKYDLLADPALDVTKQFDLVHPKVSFISHRATVIVDKEGKVAFVQVQQETPKARDLDALKAKLKELA
jgi:peroxiredoxin